MHFHKARCVITVRTLFGRAASQTSEKWNLEMESAAELPDWERRLWEVSGPVHDGLPHLSRKAGLNIYDVSTSHESKGLCSRMVRQSGVILL